MQSLYWKNQQILITQTQIQLIEDLFPRDQLNKEAN